MREGEGQADQLYFKKPVKKTLRKEHAWLQFQNKLFQENKCFYRFLTDVARISLFQGFVVKKIIGDAIRPGRILIERVSFELSHVYTERTAFLLRKTQSFVTLPHTSVDCMVILLMSLMFWKNLSVTAFQPHDGSASGEQNTYRKRIKLTDMWNEKQEPNRHTANRMYSNRVRESHILHVTETQLFLRCDISETSFYFKPMSSCLIVFGLIFTTDLCYRAHLAWFEKEWVYENRPDL